MYISTFYLGITVHVHFTFLCLHALHIVNTCTSPFVHLTNYIVYILLEVYRVRDFIRITVYCKYMVSLLLHYATSKKPQKWRNSLVRCGQLVIILWSQAHTLQLGKSCTKSKVCSINFVYVYSTFYLCITVHVHFTFYVCMHHHSFISQIT